MLLSGKTEVASLEKLSGHNQSRFRTLEYDRIPAPDSIFYSEPHRYVVESVTMEFPKGRATVSNSPNGHATVSNSPKRRATVDIMSWL